MNLEEAAAIYFQAHDRERTRVKAEGWPEGWDFQYTSKELEAKRVVEAANFQQNIEFFSKHFEVSAEDQKEFEEAFDEDDWP